LFNINIGSCDIKLIDIWLSKIARAL